MGNKGDNISGDRTRGTSHGSGNPLVEISHCDASYLPYINKLVEYEFDDATTREACYAIERVGYHHLLPYLQVSYFKNTTRPHSVKEAHDTLTFDRTFQSILFKYIGIFETQFRAKYSHLMKEEYGNFALYSKDNFLREENYKASFKFYENEVRRQIRKDFKLSKIYKSNNDKLPIHAGVECMTLGTLLQLYANTKSNNITKGVASTFGTTKAELSSWAKSICDVRNVCAHFDCYLTRRQIPSIPRKIRNIKADNTSTFYIVLILLRILDYENPFNDLCLNYADELRRDIEFAIKEYAEIYDYLLPDLGFPDNYKELMAEAENGVIVYRKNSKE